MAAPETMCSADSVLSFWEGKGMDTQGMSVYDGSGLSQYNAITALIAIGLVRQQNGPSKNPGTLPHRMVEAHLDGLRLSELHGLALQRVRRVVTHNAVETRWVPFLVQREMDLR